MREITEHVIPNTGVAQLTVRAVDEPGDGGANHEYEIGGLASAAVVRVSFQNGTVSEKGLNGVTETVLLAILIDRLRSFQNGGFACRENAEALTNCEVALHWAHQRTLARMRRGVEGTHKI